MPNQMSLSIVHHSYGKCFMCNQAVELRINSKGDLIPYDENGKRHPCKRKKYKGEQLVGFKCFSSNGPRKSHRGLGN